MFYINGGIFTELPFRIVLPDGRTRTSLHELDDEGLTELGVFPCDEVKPEKTWAQYYGTPSVTVENGRATAVYPVVDYSSADADRILEEAKVRKRGEIAAARWAEMSTPTMVDGYEAVWYADKESMNDMLRASVDLQTAIALGHLPEGSGVEWKTAEGTFVNLGLNDLVTIRLLLSQRQQGLYAREAGMVAQITAAETPDDLEVIMW